MRIFEYSTNCCTITIPFLFFYRYNAKLEYKGRQNKRFISICSNTNTSYYFTLLDNCSYSVFVIFQY